MTSSITVDSGAPWGRLGTRESRATWPAGGWTIRTRGTRSNEKATSMRHSRSKRRKLPVLTAPITATVAMTTVGNLGRPRYPMAREIPMNSVTMVSALRMKRSMTLNAPQNLPKRSKMRRAWPTPDTAPRRSTISWLT